jgi:GDP-L-fucose synthase
MQIFVTGATGFLGRHLTSHLEALGHEVTKIGSKNDLTHPSALNPFCEKKFDQIYHLAAWTQAGNFCLHHPGEQWLINQKINTHLLDFWVNVQPQAKLICMGTSCSYDADAPHKEEYYLEGKPIESLFTYAMTKRMLLAGCIALQRQFNLRYLYLIPSTLYGPAYHTDGRQLHFIFDLMRKILSGKREETPVILWGDGEQKRELIHVQDFVTTLIKLVDRTENCWINVGSGQEHSIKDFAKLICSSVDYPFEKILFDVTQYVGARSKVLNVERLKRLIPNFQPRPLKAGLEETIDWFSSNIPKQGQDGSRRRCVATPD